MDVSDWVHEDGVLKALTRILVSIDECPSDGFRHASRLIGSACESNEVLMPSQVPEAVTRPLVLL